MRQAIEIDVTRCKPSPTARPIKEGQVLVLMESIKSVGLRQPINVRPLGDDFEMRGGGHRHAAFVRLGFSSIPAFVCDDDDLHAELAEIDENLIRNELSPAERAMAIARRKAIYESLHPETAQGAAPKPKRKGRQVGELSPKAERFTKATADATGTSERAVQRDASRGETLGPDVLARVVGTSLDTGEQIDALGKLTPEKREEVIDRAVAGEKPNAVAAVKGEKRAAKEKALGEVTFPTGLFNVFYCDVPSHFETYSENGMDRSAENHYPTMTLEELLDLPVPSIAAENSIIFYWTTVPMLIEHLYVLETWGFLTFRPRGPDGKLARGEDGKLVPFNPDARYVSHCIWGKDRIGTGYWFRNKHEILLVCVKGNIPAPEAGTQADSLIMAAVKDHSRKPIIFRAMIERLFPTLPKIELFARTPAPGWGQWGKEAPVLPAEVETGLDGKDIPVLSATEKREARLLEAAYADIAGEQLPRHISVPNVDEVEDDSIPDFLIRRPKKVA
jgi:N6-adenosine-specific RNA methylase IME4